MLPLPTAVAGYTPGELQQCMQQLLTLHQAASSADLGESLQPLLYIREKYSAPCWLSVACTVGPPAPGA